MRYRVDVMDGEDGEGWTAIAAYDDDAADDPTLARSYAESAARMFSQSNNYGRPARVVIVPSKRDDPRWAQDIEGREVFRCG